MKLDEVIVRPHLLFDLTVVEHLLVAVHFSFNYDQVKRILFLTEID